MLAPDRKINVLCFGDSNTWGYDPRDQSRYPESVRWTGVLQNLLGAEYRVIEEGLNGRTATLHYKNRLGKNGLEYLRPCMESHFPVDIVILYLGTNDTKVEFNQSAERIALGIEELILAVFGKGLETPSPNVKLLLVAPTLVEEAFLGDYAEFIGAEAKTQELPKLYKALADKHGAIFIDLSKVAPPSPLDGCHLTPETHSQIANIFRDSILQMIKSAPPLPLP